MTCRRPDLSLPRLQRPLLLALTLLLGLGLGPEAQAQVHRCTIDGTVTFQRDPCPSQAPRKPTTAADLNSVRPSTPSDGKDRTGNWAVKDRAGAPTPAPLPLPSTPTVTTATSAGNKAQASGFRCDGRTHCSQMTSCEEARFFVANCPGVKMDGNHDGNPCQKQWCGR